MNQPIVEVRQMGFNERGTPLYAIFVDGRERQPWMTINHARREARSVEAELRRSCDQTGTSTS